MKWIVIAAATGNKVGDFAWTVDVCNAVGIDAKACAQRLANKLNAAVETPDMFIAVEEVES